MFVVACLHEEEFDFLPPLIPQSLLCIVIFVVIVIVVVFVIAVFVVVVIIIIIRG
jgi:hypothetical protein